MKEEENPALFFLAILPECDKFKDLEEVIPKRNERNRATARSALIQIVQNDM